jgi:hypothetical protein
MRLPQARLPLRTREAEGQLFAVFRDSDAAGLADLYLSTADCSCSLQAHACFDTLVGAASIVHTSGHFRQFRHKCDH